MDGVRVDPVAKRAVVGAGCRWRDVDAETQEFGLRTTGGLVSDTGVAGYTLGGGIGHLMRKHGLAIDNLVGADLVTADGRFVHASETDEPELFWGLRGGGGNFGIVTAFEFQLHSVGPMVYGGPIFFAAEDAETVLRVSRVDRERPARRDQRVRQRAVAPPVPFLPEEHHGKQVCAVIFCHSRRPRRGREAAGADPRGGDADRGPGRADPVRGAELADRPAVPQGRALLHARPATWRA